MRKVILSLVALLMLTLTASAQTPTRRASGTATTQRAQSFELGNGKLGQLSIGQTVGSLPKQVSGLYDNFKYKKETISDEMDGDWVDESCTFYKGGKKVFACDATDGKIHSFTLFEAATNIKTTQGVAIGFNGRELYNKMPKTWETYYEGTSFVTNGHFTYHIKSSDVANSETPNRAADIKATAKVVCIVYHPEY